MDVAKSTLQFLRYETESVIFQKIRSETNGKSPEASEEQTQEFSISPKWKRDIFVLEDHCYDIVLAVLVEPTEKEPSLPIRIIVELRGHFQFTGEKMIANATAILFPYLRATLSMVMAAANEPPIMLPTMNIVKLFEGIEKQTETEDQAETLTPSETNPETPDSTVEPDEAAEPATGSETRAQGMTGV